jgi:hypothetical protein
MPSSHKYFRSEATDFFLINEKSGDVKFPDEAWGFVESITVDETLVPLHTYGIEDRDKETGEQHPPRTRGFLLMRSR